MKKKLSPLMVLWLTLVILQIAGAVCFSYSETYALEKLKYAVAVYDGLPFIIKAPYMSLLGLISRLLSVHPLVFVHTVLAIVMIPLSYFAYWFLTKTLFEENAVHRYLALCFLCVLNIFGYQSGEAMPISLLTGYYTFGGLTLHVILPFVTAFVIAKSRKLTKKKQELEAELQEKSQMPNKNDSVCEIDEEYADYQEEWDMKKHKIINARNLAIALGVTVTLLLAFVFVLNNKINQLYNATVNLQQELNSSCKTYEYAPNGNVTAYVIKNTDGSISVIRTGEIENESDFIDFVSKFGAEVSSEMKIDVIDNE